MSVFKIFKGGTDYEAEYKGTALAGKVFGELWGKPRDPSDPGKGYAIKPAHIYEELIYDLIHSKGCVVEYQKGGTDYVVQVETNGKRKVLYYLEGGEKFPIDLKVVRDDDDDDVIYMAVPFKRNVDSNAGYLGDAVNAIKNGTNERRNREFLFGTVLLKRCR